MKKKIRWMVGITGAQLYALQLMQTFWKHCWNICDSGKTISTVSVNKC